MNMSRVAHRAGGRENPPSPISHRPSPTLWLLLAALTAGLFLRLALWRWREFYPLGGDEQEYFNQALTLLRERQYVELRIMRPPLYTVFLASAILVVDSLVQNLRLVQALLSTLTIVPVWLLSREVALRTTGKADHPAALVAAWLWALSYSLAASASELLSETLFLFLLSGCFWLTLRAARPGARWAWAAAAGLTLGAACLTRSAALPLLPLGALWLAVVRGQGSGVRGQGSGRSWLVIPLAFIAGAVLLVAPWTLRNYLTYGALIVVDTSGAENLWLDNDPAGREAVKAQLYALGEDMATRQQLASREGLAVITGDLPRFAAKTWGELLKFFALEYSDDMRERRAIWVPPSEVWARLVLGDALWLLILLAGTWGMVRGSYPLAYVPVKGEREASVPALTRRRSESNWLSAIPSTSLRAGGYRLSAIIRAPGTLLGLWALYTLATTLIFHVELRYRLPLYPALIPYAALALTYRPTRFYLLRSIWLPLVCLLLTLLHRPYPLLAYQLAGKHWALARAEAALERSDVAGAHEAALTALARDHTSVLAHVALARAALPAGDTGAAERELHEALELLPAHPYAHLLLGDLLRLRGEEEAAITELAYETASLEDLQGWAWEHFGTPPPAQLDIGGGLDLGLVGGMHSREQGDWRWTKDRARIRLEALAQPGTLLLRLRSGRPPGAPDPSLVVRVNGVEAARLTIGPEWQLYSVPLPAETLAARETLVELMADTFTPRDYDPASPDGRRLGVMIDQAEVNRGEHEGSPLVKSLFTS